MASRRLLALLVISAVGLAAPALAAAPGQEQAGDPVSFVDGAFDAYRTATSGTGDPQTSAPNPLLSDPALDIRLVEWAPVPSGGPREDGGYLTAITVTGAASEDGSYVSFGEFTYKGETCQLYHFLTPGIDAFANAFCGTIQDGRTFVGRVSGSVVTTTTADGGTRLSAVFDNSRLPAPLEKSGRTLDTLSAFTCMSAQEGLGCRPHEKQDVATSSLTYRL